MLKCFLIRETHRWRLAMRRYSRTDGQCQTPAGRWYHNAIGPTLAIATCEPDPADGVFRDLPGDDLWPRDDPRWPGACTACGYTFTDSDIRQTWTEQLWIDDAGAEYTLREAPPGAMWFSDWLGEWAKGPDGRSLHVKCPDGREWLVDGPASNCGLPQDRGPYGQAHRCWIRHGVAPAIWVDKNGKTCSAGAGSIDTRHGYHGFLGTHGAPPGYFT